MTAPLRLAFDVACSADHAFTVWTSGIASDPIAAPARRGATATRLYRAHYVTALKEGER